MLFLRFYLALQFWHEVCFVKYGKMPGRVAKVFGKAAARFFDMRRLPG
ncbi:hypothetical protein LCGC14_2829420, partial [marine sediment metagenome]